MAQTSFKELRKAHRRRKPVFVVKEFGKLAKIKRRWRLPRGRHSGVRQYHKGKPALPSIGYGSPRLIHGRHISGLQPVRVASLAALQALEPARDGAVLASGIGQRLKERLLEAALQHNITLLNVPEPSKALQALKEQFAARKKASAKRKQAKSRKEKEKEAAAEKKTAEKAVAEKKDAEELKKAGSVEEEITRMEGEREEQRKLVEKTLTKKQ